MLSPELPSSELPPYGELDQLDGVIPVEKKPEMPQSIIDRNIGDFVREQGKLDEARKKPKRPIIH